MIKKITTSILTLIFCGVCYGSEITSITTSTFYDNQEISFEGTGFLTHSLDIEFLGGADGDIESATAGTVFAKTGWLVDPDCDTDACGTKAPRYDNSKKHSGSNSIISIIKDGAGYCPNYYGVDNCIQSGYSFDGTTAGGYFTWWVYFDDFENADGQWKMWRYMLGSGYRDVDTTLESSQWYNTDETNKQAYLSVWYPVGENLGSGGGFTPEIIIPQKTWCRVEVNIVPGVTGSIIYRVYKGGVVTEFFNETTNIDGTAFRYVFQNLWGNHQITGTYSSDAEISIDDHYLQTGTQARVEIVDTLNWEDRTHAEIQKPSVWDVAGTDITININQGSFPLGQAYLFVVDSTGNVSDQDSGTAGAQGLAVIFSAATTPVVTLQADKQATNPTTYTFEFSVEPGRTAAIVVSSGGGTVTCTDGNCFDDETETGVVSNVPVPSIDILTVTDSALDSGNDSITLTLPTTNSSTKGSTLKGGTLK